VVELKTAILVKLSSVAKTAAHHKSIAEQALRLMDDAIVKDSFSAVNRLGDLALDEARAIPDSDLLAQAEDAVNEAKKAAALFETASAARAVLQKSPADPKANSELGTYYCFVKADWEKGLPMLAVGADASLKDLAKRELGGTTSPQEQADLGDSWWTVADTAEGLAKARYIDARPCRDWTAWRRTKSRCGFEPRPPAA
jgi:hypothetical protein